MENGMETNYFTTTEPQDLGTEFLLPFLLCWKIIADVRAHRKHLPHGVWGNPRSFLNCFKPRIKKPKKPHKTIWTCYHILIVFQTGSDINHLSLHCASSWTPQNTFSLQLPERMIYQGITGHLCVHLSQTCSAAHNSDSTSTGQ